jgi:hypothetical protein
MYNKRNKRAMTYDIWLNKYKGLTVDVLTLDQHAKFSIQFRRWLVGNIEKV